MITVNVDLGSKSYPIHIGANILPDIGKYAKEIGVGPRILLVTNPKVGGLYGRVVTQSLAAAGFEVILSEVPDGEKYKSLESAGMLYDTAFINGLDRNSAVIALGGGVIGDLAGFVAATYMRGVPFIQIPTSLLAQVDSSVGGKVAVNHPKGKNIIGAFYQPKLVFTDINTLHTLEERQFRAGMAEVIKYGIIKDREFFTFLEDEARAVKKLHPGTIIHVVETSCRIKAEVVAEDETEQGVRAILNLGHTFGHVFEALTGYTEFVHGEAVAVGMVSAARTAVKTGLLLEPDLLRIERLIKTYGLPASFGNLDIGEIINSMYHDKKAVAGKIRYILPEALGRVSIVSEVSHEILKIVLQEQLN
ncbi:3-dehydroquinate synthase [Phosphitispora sp. TUW77]|uniref:3-dehydroquinate synthase n=1 Tax=Phosphitispora sp. TUW77 TaxID=3152361 RepID=UPI003AB8C290